MTGCSCPVIAHRVLVRRPRRSLAVHHSGGASAAAASRSSRRGAESDRDGQRRRLAGHQGHEGVEHAQRRVDPVGLDVQVANERGRRDLGDEAARAVVARPVRRDRRRVVAQLAIDGPAPPRGPRAPGHAEGLGGRVAGAATSAGSSHEPIDQAATSTWWPAVACSVPSKPRRRAVRSSDQSSPVSLTAKATSRSPRGCTVTSRGA